MTNTNTAAYDVAFAAGLFDALDEGWTLDTLAPHVANESAGYVAGATYAADLRVLAACRYADTLWICTERAGRHVDAFARLVAAGALESKATPTSGAVFAITDDGLEALAAL
jgi:uncharacterized protein YfiM (DUF2279 family)